MRVRHSCPRGAPIVARLLAPCQACVFALAITDGDDLEDNVHFVAEDPGAFNLHQEAVRKHRGRHHREPHRLRTRSALARTATEL